MLVQPKKTPPLNKLYPLVKKFLRLTKAIIDHPDQGRQHFTLQDVDQLIDFISQRRLSQLRQQLASL
ncbi:hypothetical protein I2491_03330, partial [Levilactobacillus brevis]|nr:hypothetical protein [Levilactobacillus brevis]